MVAIAFFCPYFIDFYIYYMYTVKCNGGKWSEVVSDVKTIRAYFSYPFLFIKLENFKCFMVNSNIALMKKGA